MAQTKPKAGQFYGVSNNGTDGEFLQTDGTGGMTWAAPISNPTITSIDYPGSQTAVNPAGGESVIINGTLFASGITCTVGGTAATTAFNSATQITITTPAKAAGPYTVAVTNTNGGTASQANFIQYSGIPIWSTAAGTLGNITEGNSASFQVTAAEGTDTIEYTVTTGSLPTGLSLATATGTITGTAPSVSADTTTTFSITAIDDENQTSASRSFSITVKNDGPSNYFNTVIYTGTNAAQSVTGVGFKPDFVWFKNRLGTNDHAIVDSVRTRSSYIYPNDTHTAQSSGASNDMTSFDSDGFSLGVVSQAGSTNTTTGGANNLVAWCWKAGGAAVNNTEGDITSQVSAVATSGFSIATYTGNGSGNQTIGNGLTGGADLIFIKNLTVGDDWAVFTSQLAANQFMELARSYAAGTNSALSYTINSTTLQLTSGSPHSMINASGSNYAMYSWKSVAGFSKVGTYTGNGITNGTIVNTGFEPAFIIIKRTDGTGSWYMYDNKRSTTNPWNDILQANEPAAEDTDATYSNLIYLTNGFQLKTTNGEFNGSGSTYLYFAMAAEPETSTPSLADSFNTVLNTSPTTSQSISAGGFTPDAVWIKGYNIGSGNPTSWGQYDTVRGSAESLQSDNADVQFNYSGHPSGNLGMDFTSTGYDVPPVVNNNINNSSDDYVSYFWKAGGAPSINTNGTGTSIVSANQAAGFSIIANRSPAGSYTWGHGLSQAPELWTHKALDYAYGWETLRPKVFGNASGSLNPADWEYGFLNTTAGFGNQTAYSADNSVLSSTGWGQANNFITYAWHSVAGYSKIATYTGNGSTTGPIVNTGFQPTFLLVKRQDSADNWLLFDNKRNTYNPTNLALSPNNTAAQSVGNLGNGITLQSTGFQLATTDGGLNANNGVYLYFAIKEN